MIGERLPVEEIRPGDEIELPVLGFHIVSSVDVDAGRVRIIYFRPVETTLSKSNGMIEHRRLVERGTKPYDVGDLITARRGSPGQAERLRARMVAEQEERNRAAAERYAPLVAPTLDPEPEL